MPASTGPNLGLSYGWTPRNGGTPGESGWGAPVTANFKKIDALLGLSVVSVAASPTVTTDGTRYIVAPTGATGDFANQANKVAVRVAGAWEFYVPARGWLAENQATGTIYKFNGTTWAEVDVPAQDYLLCTNPGASTIPNGSTYTKLPFFTKTADTANGWNATDHTYTPARAGLFLVEVVIQPVRSGTNPMAAGVNIEIGFGSSGALGVNSAADTAQDALAFVLRSSIMVRLAAGTPYYAFCKHSQATPVAFTNAALRLVRIGP